MLQQALVFVRQLLRYLEHLIKLGLPQLSCFSSSSFLFAALHPVYVDAPLQLLVPPDGLSLALYLALHLLLQGCDLCASLALDGLDPLFPILFALAQVPELLVLLDDQLDELLDVQILAQVHALHLVLQFLQLARLGLVQVRQYLLLLVRALQLLLHAIDQLLVLLSSLVCLGERVLERSLPVLLACQDLPEVLVRRELLLQEMDLVLQPLLEGVVAQVPEGSLAEHLVLQSDDDLRGSVCAHDEVIVIFLAPWSLFDSPSAFATTLRSSMMAHSKLLGRQKSPGCRHAFLMHLQGGICCYFGYRLLLLLSGLLFFDEVIQVSLLDSHGPDLLGILLLLLEHEVLHRVLYVFMEIVKLLVLARDGLPVVLQLVAELLVDGFCQLTLEGANMLLEEADILHRTIEAIDDCVPLLKYFGIRQSLDIVVDVAATQLERLDLEVLVLNDFD